MPSRVAVIADTHMPKRGTRLPDECLARIAGAELLIHAGDLCDAMTLAMLRALGAPLVAVHGNIDDDDVRDELGPSAQVRVEDLVIAVTHDPGPAGGRLERLRRRFPEAGAVIFGHTHAPEYRVAADGFFILNPGSPTERRRQPRHSMAELVVSGPIGIARFVAVDEPVGGLPAELVLT